MEDVLALYERKYNPKKPIVCMDERPCFLIGDVIAPFPMEPGKPYREHYAYVKNGSCALLACIEPLTGKRIAKVYDQRTAKEYTDFMQIIAASYPDAEKIIIVQDNLNTHQFGSFYKHLPAKEARMLVERFEFHYTPKASSWLNMIEIEFSAISRIALNRRISTKEDLKNTIDAIVKKRNLDAVKIKWQFTVNDARNVFKSKYNLVCTQNEI